MIKLNSKDYYKVEKTIQSLPINTLFARSIICKKMQGTIFVDDENNPSTFYISHPYGMSLIFGETKNDHFNKEFRDYMINKNKVRHKVEWLQVYPDVWSKKIIEILDSDFANDKYLNNNEIINGKVVLNTRVNFTFHSELYNNSIKPLIKNKYKIVQTTKEMFNNISGSVIPKYFWNDKEEFYKHGLGFSLIYEGEIASTAFSAFRSDSQLEIGIETSEKYQGKGFAFYVCKSIIDYCLKNKLEPVWACRLENEGSYKLAQKLGFIPTMTIPCFRFAV